MAVTTPHFASPFTLAPSGRVIVNEQNSQEDVEDAVYNVVVCPQGAKLGDPSFGVPFLLFSNLPLDTGPTVAAIQRLEPRATVAIIQSAATNAGIENLMVNVSVAGST